jgi:hypothetical protein
MIGLILFCIVTFEKYVYANNCSKPVIFSHVGQETGKLQKLVIGGETEPHISISMHLVSHDVVADCTEGSFKD